VWESLGEFALDRRDYRRAETAHRALVRLEPGNGSAWLRLGATLARQEKWREAREAVAKGRAIDPGAPVDEALLAFLDKAAAGLR
jgi:Flp pilus assembly protein TadD